MENIQYTIGNKYIIISQNRIQSRKYMINKITIGTLTTDTGKTLMFKADTGIKRIRKYTIAKLIDITNIVSMNEQFLIDRIEGVLV